MAQTPNNKGYKTIKQLHYPPIVFGYLKQVVTTLVLFRSKIVLQRVVKTVISELE